MAKHPIRRKDIFDEMRRRFDDVFFEPFFRDRENFLSSLRGPYTDMIETEKEVIFTVEIPGVKKEDIDINVTEDRIEVGVESKKEQERKDEGEYAYEGRYDGFSSTYSTPAPIEPDSVKASYRNGVLELRAKKVKSAKGKKISVN